MTETVTLALEGRLVQIGRSDLTDDTPVTFRLTKSGFVQLMMAAHGLVVLDESARADLRDILNALAERWQP